MASREPESDDLLSTENSYIRKYRPKGEFQGQHTCCACGELRGWEGTHWIYPEIEEASYAIQKIFELALLYHVCDFMSTAKGVVALVRVRRLLNPYPWCGSNISSLSLMPSSGHFQTLPKAASMVDG